MNEERYITSLQSFTNAIGNIATGRVNIVLQKKIWFIRQHTFKRLCKLDLN